MNYDLESRLLLFSRSLIEFLKKRKISFWNKNILEQVLKSGTSIGANYSEANGAVSSKEFTNKISICRKEAKETVYWLQLIKEEVMVDGLDDYIKLYQEAREIMLIFNKIAETMRKKSKMVI